VSCSLRSVGGDDGGDGGGDDGGGGGGGEERRAHDVVLMSSLASSSPSSSESKGKAPEYGDADEVNRNPLMVSLLILFSPAETHARESAMPHAGGSRLLGTLSIPLISTRPCPGAFKAVVL